MAHHDAGLAVWVSTRNPFPVRAIPTADTPAARSTPADLDQRSNRSARTWDPVGVTGDLEGAADSGRARSQRGPSCQAPTIVEDVAHG
jgi:hypothetical protein